MTERVERFAEARLDLLDIWLYIAEDDLEATDRLSDRIESRLGAVASPLSLA